MDIEARKDVTIDSSEAIAALRLALASGSADGSVGWFGPGHTVHDHFSDGAEGWVGGTRRLEDGEPVLDIGSAPVTRTFEYDHQEPPEGVYITFDASHSTAHGDNLSIDIDGRTIDFTNLAGERPASRGESNGVAWKAALDDGPGDETFKIEVYLPETYFDDPEFNVTFNSQGSRDWMVDNFRIREGSGYRESQFYLQDSEVNSFIGKIENAALDLDFAVAPTLSLWNDIQLAVGNTGLKGHLNTISHDLDGRSLDQISTTNVHRLAISTWETLGSWSDHDTGLESMTSKLWQSFETLVASDPSLDAVKDAAALASGLSTAGIFASVNIPAGILASMGTINLVHSAVAQREDTIDTLPSFPDHGDINPVDAFIMLRDEAWVRPSGSAYGRILNDHIEDGLEEYADFLANLQAASIIGQLNGENETAEDFRAAEAELEALGFDATLQVGRWERIDKGFYIRQQQKMTLEVKDGERDLAEDFSVEFYHQKDHMFGDPWREFEFLDNFAVA